MISIILPVYQVEDYIENCLNSILRQTYKDFELIIVNDGTKDNSILIAENLLKESDIIYYIFNQNNQGVSVARNNGIKYSNGDWIICVDPDDVLDYEFLSQLYKSNIQNNTEVSIGSYQMIDEYSTYKKNEKEKNIKIIKQKKLLEDFLFRKIKIISPAMLINKEYLIKNDLWYDETMRFSEDVHWIWRVILNVDEVSYVTKDIYNYILHKNSTMTSSSIKKILTGYRGFEKLNSNLTKYNAPQITEFLFDRWVLGVLHAAAKILTYKNYKRLIKAIPSKNHMSALRRFPDARVKILSCIFIINKYAFYRLCRWF